MAEKKKKVVDISLVENLRIKADQDACRRLSLAATATLKGDRIATVLLNGLALIDADYKEELRQIVRAAK